MKLKFLSTKELSGKKTAELDKYIADMKNSLSELKRDIARSKENKTHQVSLVKKTIARAKTVQTTQVNGKGKEK